LQKRGGVHKSVTLLFLIFQRSMLTLRDDGRLERKISRDFLLGQHKPAAPE
jgi:hypothetical protein